MSEFSGKTKVSVLRGFAGAAIFSWLTILLWVAPSYIGSVHGTVQWGFYIVGGVTVVFSFRGASQELDRLLQSKGSSWLGRGLVWFLVPAILLHTLTTYASLTTFWLLAFKVTVLLLTLFGGGSVFYGIAVVLKEAEERRSQPKPQTSTTGRGNAIVAILSFISAILPITLLKMGYIANMVLRLFGE